MTKRSRLRRAIAKADPIDVTKNALTLSGVILVLSAIFWRHPWEVVGVLACIVSVVLGIMVYHRAAKALVDWARRGDE